MKALSFSLALSCYKMLCSLRSCFSIYLPSRLRGLGGNRGAWGGGLLIHIKHYLRLGFPKVDPEMWGGVQMVHLAELTEETQMIQWKNRTRKFACLNQMQIRSSHLIGLHVS